ncbi:21370_t:CDS:2 [Gigaspora rosea]|nr:21370_t:CDS:2 [Gigaspora rosea]
MSSNLDLYNKLTALDKCLNDGLLSYKEYSKYKKKILKSFGGDKSGEKSFWRKMYDSAFRGLKYATRNLIMPILTSLGVAGLSNVARGMITY